MRERRDREGGRGKGGDGGMRKKGSEKDRGRRERRRCIGREKKRVKVFTAVTVDNLHNNYITPVL